MKYYAEAVHTESGRCFERSECFTAIDDCIKWDRDCQRDCKRNLPAVNGKYDLCIYGINEQVISSQVCTYYICTDPDGTENFTFRP